MSGPSEPSKALYGLPVRGDGETGQDELGRPGHDLHDALGQTLAGLSYLVKGLADKQDDRLGDHRATLEAVVKAANDAVRHHHHLRTAQGRNPGFARRGTMINKASPAPVCQPWKVLIVDDHPLVRQGIRMLLECQSDFAVSGEAASAHEALEAMGAEMPDAAIVDLTLKDSSGLDLIKDIQIRHPRVLVLVVSMRDEGFYAERVLRAGARGYVTKEEGPEEVLRGLRHILSGQIHVSDRVASKVMQKLIGGTADRTGSLLDGLTDRELQIFDLIGNGLPTRDIAHELHISTKTVDSHREHIKEKLRLGSASELLRHAIQWVQCQKKV